MLRSSYAQVCLLGICHFCSIGMWNALNGIGSLGTDDPELAHYCNSVMYLTGIIGGLLGGMVVNIIGVKWSTVLGLTAQSTTLGAYCLYYFGFRTPRMLTLVVLYNGLSSLGISCFTSAVGTALCYYPEPNERNKFISTSSVILNLGGFAGGVLAAVMNFRSLEQPALSLKSYSAIILVSIFGVIISLFFIAPQNHVKMTGGGCPKIERQQITHEIKHIPHQFTNKFLYLLMPLFLVNVWHEVVLFNYFNAGLFNIRSRALNSCCYYLARIFAGFLFHYVCEHFAEGLRGRVRAVVILINCLLFIGSFCALHTFYDANNYELAAGGIELATVGSEMVGAGGGLLDFTDHKAILVQIAFIIYGSLETISANFTFWLLAELNIGDSQTRNRIIGLSRSFINLGGCLSWSLDVLFISPFLQWCINLLIWLLSISGVLVAAAINDSEHIKGGGQQHHSHQGGEASSRGGGASGGEGPVIELSATHMKAAAAEERLNEDELV